eukprot:gene17798-16552_t
MDKTEAAPQPLGAAGSDSTPAAATNQAPALQVADAASGGVPSKGGGGRGDGDGGGEGSGSKPPANRRDSEFTSEIFKIQVRNLNKFCTPKDVRKIAINKGLDPVKVKKGQ